MRIIAGKYRGKIIFPPLNFNARPTTDFAKESIFTMIHNTFNIENLTVLDLFSGTGSIAYEFCSRCCKELIAVEQDTLNAKYIKQQFEILNFNQATLIKENAFKYLKNCKQKFDIIFADPPYKLENINEIHDIVFKNDLLNPDSWLIIEHSDFIKLNNLPNFKIKKQYGSVNFSIFET